MLDTLNSYLLAANNFVWSYIIIGLCVGVGLYVSLRLLFIQFRCFPHAIALLLGRYDDKGDGDGITTFQALATALSSTTGIGNIAGVAVAIALGGPGAIFWMWVMALLGMGLKFVEGTLGSYFRHQMEGPGSERGGGPMVYIQSLGPRWKPVAQFYAWCTAIACFGAWNMFQSNQAAASLQDQFNIPVWVTGVVMSVLVALVLVGGIKRIGRVAARLVPTMCVIYVCTAMLICFMNWDKIPAVLSLIVSEAFNFDSASGGVLGTAILIGIRRAVFSNEAGTGTAAIAHAAADTRYPVRQGIAASLGPFIDTIVVCAATAFVILLSGFYGTEAYQNPTGERVSFETPQSAVAEPTWRHQAIGNTRQPVLQQVTDGDQALVAQISEAHAWESPTIKLPQTGADAIRFSLYTEQQDIELRLLGNNDELVAEMAVNHQASDAGWMVNGRFQLNQWQSLVVLPKAADSAQNVAAIQFKGKGQGVFQIDRVERVQAANGIVLSIAAFSHFFGVFGTVFIPLAAFFFAYSTVLAGNYYGEVACHHIDRRLVRPYLWLYIAATFVGCVVNLDVAINFSDLTLGLMTIPNLIAMLILLPIVIKETREYFSLLREGALND